MILLLGGTSETPAIVRELVGAGYRVLVSTATGIPSCSIIDHPCVRKRSGPLDGGDMEALIAQYRIRAIVDATHPYARLARETAVTSAAKMNIPCLVYMRPPCIFGGENVVFADSHEEAARVACSRGRAVLLTTGSRNLLPYAREARRAGVVLVARVLAEKGSIDACRAAGIGDEFMITGRGPFSVEDNRKAIRRFGIGVLVTKDGGEAGGVPGKMEAARLEKCLVVVVRRPPVPTRDAFDNIRDLIAAVKSRMPIYK